MGEARFLRNIVMAFDDDDFMARTGEEIGSANANDSAADDCNLFWCHLFNLSLLIDPRRSVSEGRADDAAGRQRAAVREKVGRMAIQG